MKDGGPAQLSNELVTVMTLMMGAKNLATTAADADLTAVVALMVPVQDELRKEFQRLLPPAPAITPMKSARRRPGAGSRTTKKQR